MKLALFRARTTCRGLTVGSRVMRRSGEGPGSRHPPAVPRAHPYLTYIDTEGAGPAAVKSYTSCSSRVPLCLPVLLDLIDCRAYHSLMKGFLPIFNQAAGRLPILWFFWEVGSPLLRLFWDVGPPLGGDTEPGLDTLSRLTSRRLSTFMGWQKPRGPPLCSCRHCCT
jgi:hypothetical protein